MHREIDALLPQMGAGLQPQGLRAQAMYLAQRGDHAAALACIDQLLAICSDVEVPERDQGAYRVQRANVLVALQHDEAVAELERLRPSQTGTQGELLEVLRAFALAARAVDTAHGDPAPVLAEAFGGAARLHFNRFFLTSPPLAARLRPRSTAASRPSSCAPPCASAACRRPTAAAELGPGGCACACWGRWPWSGTTSRCAGPARHRANRSNFSRCWPPTAAARSGPRR